MIKEPFSFQNIETHYLSALRDPWYRQLIALQDLIQTETCRFYHSKNITTMHLPITTGSISSPMGRGSDSSPVKISLFGQETYLADSMQFLLEYGCRMTDHGCYYIMPSFRGEQADSRHLCQFYHSEAEIPGTLEDIMNLAEEYVRFLAAAILEKQGDTLKASIGDIRHIQQVAGTSPFPRITFDEAEALFQRLYPDSWRSYILYEDGYRNISREAEAALIAHFNGPVWLTHYDELTVPFYQKSENGVAKNADLLMGIGETIGCGQRHETHTQVLEALARHQVAAEEYGWYLEMKRAFPLQTAGFGMGIERFLMWVLKATDIRNFQICPRFNGINILP